jgi:beta-glucanase (GH16 family)
MKNLSVKKQFYRLPILILPLLAVIFSLMIQSCDKDETADFAADFTFEYLDDNHVRFTNKSSGEYSWMVWDFDNGVTDTVTDKNLSPEVYFSVAGSYDVTLKISNFYGSEKSVTKTVDISKDDLVVSFTATINPANPNYVVLTNTTLGQYNSFSWKYLDKVVENQMQHTAYFPYAGDYNIQLVVTLNNTDFSNSQPITITDDDPNYDPNLIWAEEFDYTGLPDPAKWNQETGGGGWGNNELQYYTDSENNAYVENGVLTITAREEQVGGRDYTSARITTQNKFDFKYGRIEARIKLPYGQGMWPAFWMLGANLSQVGWPACGEIDIMEMVGGVNRDNTCHSTIHWDNDGQHAQYGLPYTLPSGIFADNFHVFSVRWDAQEIRGYVDDIEYFVADVTPAGLSEFQNNFFIILNLAVGGNWPGPPDATTVFPQTMEIDWVRVYQE